MPLLWSISLMLVDWLKSINSHMPLRLSLSNLNVIPVTSYVLSWTKHGFSVLSERGCKVTSTLDLVATLNVRNCKSMISFVEPYAALKCFAESVWGQYFRNTELERTIDKDLMRLYPENGSFFQSPGCQAILRRILLVWSLIHPESSYRQGISGYFLLHVVLARFSHSIRALPEGLLK